MKKKVRIPAFLMDYTSLWNPLMEAFMCHITGRDDIDHGFREKARVDLIDQKWFPMIETSKLLDYGGKTTLIRKNETLFREGGLANYYYQVVEGSIKMITNSKDGQEFIQGIFGPDNSFGEPPLFCDFPYPASAVAIEDSKVLKLPKDQFFRLLKENFEIHLKFDQVLCNRLKYKSMILSDISFYDPEHRIMSLLKHLKGNDVSGDTTNRMIRSAKPYVIPFTRQQLADMSGLRVETVIRTVKKMEEKGKLEIVGRKITI